MHRNKVVLGILLLAVLWAGNLFYYRQHQLLKPLFMQHYYDLRGDKISLHLFYLTNRNQKAEVIALEIPGYFPVSATPYEFADYKYYKLMRTTALLDRKDLKSILKTDRLKLTDLQVTYSDGKKQKVNIGEVNIRLDDQPGPEYLPQSSGGSSDGANFAEFKIGQPVKITGVDYMFADRLADALQLYINDKPVQKSLFPLEINANQPITVKNSFAFDPQKDTRIYNMYHFEMLLKLEKADGSKSAGSVLIYNNPYFNSDAELQNFIKERRQP